MYYSSGNSLKPPQSPYLTNQMANNNIIPVSRSINSQFRINNAHISVSGAPQRISPEHFHVSNVIYKGSNKDSGLHRWSSEAHQIH